jgi:hypothetical protein
MIKAVGINEKEIAAMRMNTSKIIAVDFDGCLAEDRFPDIGGPIRETLDALLEEQERGTKIILWTCRRDAQLDDAAGWCKARGIKLGAVNENLPEMVELYGEYTRKIFASEYWDDRARKMPPRAAGQPDLEAFANKFLAENIERGAMGDLSDENLERSFARCLKPLNPKYYDELRLEIAKALPSVYYALKAEYEDCLRKSEREHRLVLAFKRYHRSQGGDGSACGLCEYFHRASEEEPCCSCIGTYRTDTNWKLNEDLLLQMNKVSGIEGSD